MKEAHKGLKIEEEEFQLFMDIFFKTMTDDLKFDKDVTQDIIEICEVYRDDVLNRYFVVFFFLKE